MSKTQEIYNVLRAAGLTASAALGMLGNWKCESGLEANRLQGDFNPFRTSSKSYTAKVMSGAISKEEFSRDSKGYGLAQWTYWSRKSDLYDYWKTWTNPPLDLDDALMQTRFALAELAGDYQSLYAKLKTETDLYTCVKLICTQYEQPAMNNIDARFAAAQQLKGQLDLDGTYEGPETVLGEPVETKPGWETVPATEYWPPRTVDRNMSGKDVKVLQAVLAAREYPIPDVDGNFGSYLEVIVKQFQQAHGLEADGIVGPKTWARLLER